MTHVATLIADPGAIDARVLDRARALLPNAQGVQWLAPGAAADIAFNPGGSGNLRAVADSLRSTKIDVVIQPAAGRRKKLFLADMDSTMIGQECIDELADYAGLKPKIAAITERAMRGEIEFAPALRERVALLKDLPLSTIDDVLQKRITPTAGARTLVATMRTHGALTCLVSGGFTLFTDRVAAMIGFDEAHANTLGVEDGRLTGGVAEPIFGCDAKRRTLLDLRTRLGLANAQTLVAGDGANDIDMIAEAGLGVAFHAKPKVAAVAAVRIDHADLTALLYAQGYRRDEFVEG